MMRQQLLLLAELSKVKITFAVALTTIAGYLLASGSFDAGLILPTIGIFILACGSSALNHYQDSDRDGLMKRTRNRPIPSGRVTKNQVLILALVLTVLGSALIYIGSDFLGMQLGLLAMIWYNGIYTPMKRKTAFAVIPGSVIGAIPPVVGWVAGGGELFDSRVLILAFFFFIWQVPHFWLLILKYGKEYEDAGYPSLTQLYDEKQIRYITFLWTFATAVTALMLPLFGLIHHVAITLVVLASVAWLVIVFLGILRKQHKPFNPFYYFMRINYFVLAIIVALSVDPLIQ
ncbi:MAG: protoheme IX farnesyltransferase [Bacteroidales bacterium]|jgi:protoheme IX farnesyltransferase|nr:protoheme IX farnesyltransferase [Bacteroidales bacterium]MDY0084728.1 protoheme IX farnesyltransferase [Bacteroidales bacterium]